MRTEVVDIQYASEVCGRISDRSALMQFFPLTMPDTNVNSLKKENESLKSEIAALKKNFEDFQNSLKLSVNDANVSNNGSEAS